MPPPRSVHAPGGVSLVALVVLRRCAPGETRGTRQSCVHRDTGVLFTRSLPGRSGSPGLPLSRERPNLTPSSQSC